MPNVVGKPLDVAISDVERAGFDDEVEVLGGGIFGVVDESNWTVCSQEPAKGSEVSSAPRLTVDRSCETDHAPEPTSAVTPSEAPSEEPSEEPTETQPPEPTAEEILTVDNNQDLKTLLMSSEDYSLSKAFAKTYAGRRIEFDGNVASAASHNGASTRFDFLIYAGDYSDTVANPGPSFQFRDVNFYDLNLQGRGSGVGMEDNLHIVAEVGEFEPRTGLFRLEPFRTRLR